MTMVHTVHVGAEWDNYDDRYEDEPLDVVRQIMRREPDAITGPLLAVLDVAEALLSKLGGAVDGWKLQRLCYLVQARHLAQTALPAFGEPIEAWTHGPVVDRLYQEHKRLSVDGTVHGDPYLPYKEDSVGRIIDGVVDDYAGWSGSQLRELVRNQRPWIEARQGLAPDESSRRKIATATMREYFRFLETLPSDDAEDANPPH